MTPGDWIQIVLLIQLGFLAMSSLVGSVWLYAHGQQVPDYLTHLLSGISGAFLALLVPFRASRNGQADQPVSLPGPKN